MRLLQVMQGVLELRKVAPRGLPLGLRRRLVRLLLLLLRRGPIHRNMTLARILLHRRPLLTTMWRLLRLRILLLAPM